MLPLLRNSDSTLSSNSPQEPKNIAPPVLEQFGSDQAAPLRQFMSEDTDPSEGIKRGRSLAILSGKGGVGKTNIAVNLALAAGHDGARVAVLDADLGLANVDILFGMMPRYNLSHVITGEKRLEDVIVTVDENVKIIPGGAGVQSLAELDPLRREQLLEKLLVLEKSEDFLIVDTAAGIYESVLSFALAVETVLLVTTPEPTAIRDAYGVLKALSRTEAGRKKDIRLIVNMAYNEEDAQSVAERIQMAANQFLGMSVPFAGYIPWDPNIRKAVQKRRPFYLSYPSTAASKALASIARRLFFPEELVAEPRDAWHGTGGIREFFLRLMKKS
jgi:flagellar biosynthesis protein FlhG